MEKVFKYDDQRRAYLSLRSDDNMIRVTRSCILIMVFTFLEHVESGYEYQAPRVTFQQSNQYSVLAPVGQSALNSKQSVSYSTIQDNNNYIRHEYRQYHNRYQNALNSYNSNNGFGNNIQSGPVPQNVQKKISIPVQPAQSTVTKHIYFHVPPPDEDRPVQSSLTANRKKTYNIVFIKLPSQKPYYTLNSLGVRSNPHAVVEDKTLIYVLVKNPQNQSHGLSTVSPPNHEVYYIKYKGSSSNVASQINGGVSQQKSVLSLKPGLINGQ